MDELIKELWKKFMCKPLVDGGYTKKDGFKQAIQTACKAQRNACAREYLAHDRTELKFNTVEYVNGLVRNERMAGVIMMSKIEREDYENISD